MRAAAAAFVATARSPDLRRAQLSFAGASGAEWAFTVALGVYAFEQGGTAAVGLVTVLRMVPAALFAPAATSLVDRWPRERVLIGVSTVRAAATGAAALVVAAGGPPAAVYLLAVLSTVAATLYRPAHSALLPSLCRTPYELTSANVVRGMLDSAATLLGPAAAAVLLGLSGVTAALAGACLASVWSALLLLRVHVHDRPVLTDRTPGRLAAEVLDGLRTVGRNGDLLMLVVLTGIQTVMRGALTVFTVVVAIDRLGTGSAGAGTLTAAVGAGALAGSVAASFLVGSRRLARWFGVGVALWGTPIALLAATDGQGVTLVLLMAVGVGNALVDAGLFTLVARLAPDAVLGRVFGVLEAVGALAIAAGSVLASGLTDALGLRAALVVVGCVAPVAALGCWGRLRRLDTTMVLRDDDVERLRAVPMLSPLALPALEHLARGLVAVEVPAGRDVVTEGDAGDCFYLLVDGTADVVGGGRTVFVLGPGDAFGEIALLRRVPRTATVRARTALRLQSLSSERFLTVVTGSPSAVRVVTSHMDDQLARYSPTPRDGG